MADPLSITTGVLTLLGICGKVGWQLHQFHGAAKVVDSTIEALTTDVDNLTNVLEALKDTVNVTRAGKVEETGHIGTHWRNLSNSVASGQDVLDKLGALLERIGRETNLLSKPRMQLRFYLAADEFSRWQQRLQGYRDTIQLSMTTVLLWHQVTDRTSDPQDVPDLAHIDTEIRRLARLFTQRIETNETSPAGEDSALEIRIAAGLRECVHSAATVLSSASTVLSANARRLSAVPASSDYGDVFPKRIGYAMQRWLTSRSEYEYDMQEASFMRRDSKRSKLMEGDMSDVESETELETDLILSLLNRGSSSLLANQDDQAESTLLNCMSRIEALQVQSGGVSHVQIVPLQKSALQLLVRIYIKQCRWDDAQRQLQKRIKLDGRGGDAEHREDLSAMVEILLRKGDYVQAHRGAREVWKAYRRLPHSDGRTACIAHTLHLLIAISQQQGKASEVEAYSARLADMGEIRSPTAGEQYHFELTLLQESASVATSAPSSPVPPDEGVPAWTPLAMSKVFDRTETISFKDSSTSREATEGAHVDTLLQVNPSLSGTGETASSPTLINEASSSANLSLLESEDDKRPMSQQSADSASQSSTLRDRRERYGLVPPPIVPTDRQGSGPAISHHNRSLSSSILDPFTIDSNRAETVLEPNQSTNSPPDAHHASSPSLESFSSAAPRIEQSPYCSEILATPEDDPQITGIIGEARDSDALPEAHDTFHNQDAFSWQEWLKKALIPAFVRKPELSSNDNAEADIPEQHETLSAVTDRSAHIGDVTSEAHTGSHTNLSRQVNSPTEISAVSGASRGRLHSTPDRLEATISYDGYQLDFSDGHAFTDEKSSNATDLPDSALLESLETRQDVFSPTTPQRLRSSRSVDAPRISSKDASNQPAKASKDSSDANFDMEIIKDGSFRDLLKVHRRRQGTSDSEKTLLPAPELVGLGIARPPSPLPAPTLFPRPDTAELSDDGRLHEIDTTDLEKRSFSAPGHLLETTIAPPTMPEVVVTPVQDETISHDMFRKATLFSRVRMLSIGGSDSSQRPSIQFEPAALRRKACCIGDVLCGKTAMLTYCCSGTYDISRKSWEPTPLYKSNVRVEIDEPWKAWVDMTMLEAPGDECFQQDTKALLASCNVVIIAFDLADEVSLANVLSRWAPEAAAHAPHKPVILTGCRADRREEAVQKSSRGSCDPDKIIQILCQIRALTYIETSAATGQGIDRLLRLAAEAAMHRPSDGGKARHRRSRSMLYFRNLMAAST